MLLKVYHIMYTMSINHELVSGYFFFRRSTCFFFSFDFTFFRLRGLSLRSLSAISLVRNALRLRFFQCLEGDTTDA